MMSSSKSYLYGRPVTEWSTPPPLSSKARTALLRKGELGEPATKQSGMYKPSPQSLPSKGIGF